MCQYIETVYAVCRCYTTRLWKICHLARARPGTSRCPGNVTTITIKREIKSLCYVCLDEASEIYVDARGALILQSRYAGCHYMGEWNQTIADAIHRTEMEEAQELEDSKFIHVQALEYDADLAALEAEQAEADAKALRAARINEMRALAAEMGMDFVEPEEEKEEGKVQQPNALTLIKQAPKPPRFTANGRAKRANYGNTMTLLPTKNKQKRMSV